MNLKTLDVKKLSAIAMVARGEARRPKFGSKAAALKAVDAEGVTKQSVVLGMLHEGATVTEIEEALSVSRHYARDIIAKLQMKGHTVVKDGDTFRLRQRKTRAKH